MPGHTRLYRRGATYYHRAAVPSDIVDTYGKREETFSLRTKDHTEAVKKVRIKHEAIAAYLDGHGEQHVLSDGHIREELWDSAMLSAQTDEVRQSLASKWKQLVRAEYLLRALTTHVHYEY